jgi:FG-GAP-like repeat/FG-GAP repeat
METHTHRTSPVASNSATQPAAPVAACFSALVAALATSLGVASLAAADDRDLAAYFGFDGLEVIKIDNNAGPFIVVDVNGDGLNDLVVANNTKSRIEVQYQKAGAKPTDEVKPPSRVNELPEHWRFRRESISVGHQITGMAAYDFDGDTLLDLIYAGQPGTIGFLRQTKPGVFELARKTAVKGLSPQGDAFVVADLVGDSRKDIAAIASGRLTVWPLDGTTMGDETQLGSTGDQLVAILSGDFNTDGLQDVIGVAPDHPTPVRLWLASQEGGTKGLGSQLRFEMPPIVEATPLPIPSSGAAVADTALAVIERATKRLVVYDLKEAAVESAGTREAPLTVWSFADPGNRKRSVAVADVDGDGLLDLLATNRQDNAVAFYRQASGKGLLPPINAPAYADLDSVVAANIGGGAQAELFLLSEKEGVVGRTTYAGAGGIGFPQALSIAAGHVPVVQSLVKLDEGPRLAVVAKDGRNYVLELLPIGPSAADGAGPTREPIKLGSLAKQPDAVVALDADQDGRTDILLLTADKPMIMLHRNHEKNDYDLRESKDMGQFGLVQAANDLNNAVLDIDGDGKAELLVADRNFIRALRYEEKPAAGSSPGWQVVRQINADRGDAKLVSLAVLPGSGTSPASLVASDRENSTLLLFNQKDGTWQQTDALTVSGFKFTDVKVGAFSGDGVPDVLVVGEDGFAVARLSGSRLALNEIASWRSDSQRRTPHEIVVGDVNGDQRVDLVSLDASEQMAEVLTFSDARRLLYATGFKVFESRMFSGGEPREFEPSMGTIVDVTGDGAADLILLCHDRLLLYPQATKPRAAAK